MGNNILDANISLLPVYISLAVQTDRLVYVFNTLVIGECQQMSTDFVLSMPQYSKAFRSLDYKVDDRPIDDAIRRQSAVVVQLLVVEEKLLPV